MPPEHYTQSVYFPHRAFAVFFAVSLRCFLVSLAARSSPPLAPHSFPSATARSDRC